MAAIVPVAACARVAWRPGVGRGTGPALRFTCDEF